MVEKDLGLVDALTFADAHEKYPQDEKIEIYNEIFIQEEFSKADRLILTGAPNNKEETQRRELLIDYLNDFADEDNIPTVQTTQSHRKQLIKDERIDENNYIFESMNPDSSIDELQIARDRLDTEEKTIVFTNDYHAPRVEKRANSMFSENWKDTRDSWTETIKEFLTDPQYGDSTNDYLILGAELNENEFSSQYEEKWVSETIRTILPQKPKDIAKKYLLDY